MSTTGSGQVFRVTSGGGVISSPQAELLRGRGIRISMTEENHCYENALAERMNGILKDEYSLDATFADYGQAQ
ncbi:MAG: integrase core domain-containing protein [Prevotellaceae bacterium]|nr:integrase core domain-containing protein [Prevotellaceae bacterium]